MLQSDYDENGESRMHRERLHGFIFSIAQQPI